MLSNERGKLTVQIQDAGQKCWAGGTAVKNTPAYAGNSREAG